MILSPCKCGLFIFLVWHGLVIISIAKQDQKFLAFLQPSVKTG